MVLKVLVVGSGLVSPTGIDIPVDFSDLILQATSIELVLVTTDIAESIILAFLLVPFHLLGSKASFRLLILFTETLLVLRVLCTTLGGLSLIFLGAPVPHVVGQCIIGCLKGTGVC